MQQGPPAVCSTAGGPPGLVYGRHFDPLIVRAPSVRALEAARAVIRAFPLHLLKRAAARPVEIWLLDPGEALASCPLLDAAARVRRWHGGAIALDQCAGLTVPRAGRVLVVAPWHRPAVLRHELGHAVAAVLPAELRARFERSYQAARATGRFVVPLAAATPGEYLACGFAHFAQLKARGPLAERDPRLHALLSDLWSPPPRSPLRRGLDEVLQGLRLLAARPAAA